MQLKRIFLTAILVPALCNAGCNGLRSLTEPPDGLSGPYTYSMSTSLSNSTGAVTILEAQLQIDSNVVADSCPDQDLIPITDADGNIVAYDCTAPAASTVTFSSEGHIGPGTHRVLFFLNSQTTTSTPTPYTVMAFTFRVSDAKGNLIKSISLPAQSARIGSTGQDGITYTITI